VLFEPPELTQPAALNASAAPIAATSTRCAVMGSSFVNFLIT
jgi:hypothetical protein